MEKNLAKTEKNNRIDRKVHVLNCLIIQIIDDIKI